MLPEMIFDDPSLALIYTFCLSRIGKPFERTRIDGHIVSLRTNETAIRKSDFHRLPIEEDRINEILSELQNLRLMEVSHRESFVLTYFPNLSLPPEPRSSLSENGPGQLPLISFNDFSQRYLAHLDSNNYAPKTIENAERVCKMFGKWKGTSMLSQLHSSDLENYKEERGSVVKPVTVNIDCRTLKAMLEQAIRWGYLKENPFRIVLEIRIDSKLPRFLTRDEFKAIISLIDDDMLINVCKFGVLTGARRGEILNLQLKDIDFENHLITIQSSENYRVKHGKSRIIPLPKAVMPILKSIEPSDIFVFDIEGNWKAKEEFVTKGFKKFSRAAGLDEEVKFHTLRATAASWWAQAGATALQIKELLGHKYVKTTEHYTRIPPTELRNVVDSLAPF